MLFHTPEFLFYFLPAALLVHRLALVGSRNSYSTLARLCLLVATLVFYGWTHTWWLLPFAFSVVFDFGWSILLVRSTDARVRRLLCTLSVVQNILLLGYFKYWDAVVLRLVLWFPSRLAIFEPVTGLTWITCSTMASSMAFRSTALRTPPTAATAACPFDRRSTAARATRRIAGPGTAPGTRAR